MPWGSWQLINAMVKAIYGEKLCYHQALSFGGEKGKKKSQKDDFLIYQSEWFMLMQPSLRRSLRFFLKFKSLNQTSGFINFIDEKEGAKGIVWSIFMITGC